MAPPRDSPLLLTPRARSWPASFSTIDAPPDELWVRGQPQWLGVRPAVAVVGSRSPSPYGEAQAARFAQALARSGVVVVSGLARGVDATAHAGALDAGGGTIAVLGSGVDRPWPASDLVERVRAAGLLLSEYPPGTPPRKHHFPRRNRLISGLSDAVLVVEAAWASGSLITARWAADQGRTVFALPGRVDHPLSRGTHRLIREGARLVEDPEEILDDLGLGQRSRSQSPGSPYSPGSRDSPGSPDSRGEPTADELDISATDGAAILTALRGDTLGADEIAERLGADIGDVLTRLVLLELCGRIVRGAGGLYRLALPR